MENTEWAFISDSKNNSNWARISPCGSKILVKELITSPNVTTANNNGTWPHSIRYFLIDVDTCKKSETELK